MADRLPLIFAAGWVVRVPGLNAEEGHEAITRDAWQGLSFTPQQQHALIGGVRAPDVSLLGLLTSVLPFAQRRHALRSWSSTSTAAGIRDMRRFLSGSHARAMAARDGPGRWIAIGKVLHCLQDSYSPAHTDRLGARIVRMRHWGPMDRRRGLAGAGAPDEHGFPTDARDDALTNGVLNSEAQAAAAVSRRYLELVVRHSGAPVDGAWRREFEEFLDAWVSAPS